MVEHVQEAFDVKNTDLSCSWRKAPYCGTQLNLLFHSPVHYDATCMGCYSFNVYYLYMGNS